jgi:hypothetical protein
MINSNLILNFVMKLVKVNFCINILMANIVTPDTHSKYKSNVNKIVH